MDLPGGYLFFFFLIQRTTSRLRRTAAAVVAESRGAAPGCRRRRVWTAGSGGESGAVTPASAPSPSATATSLLSRPPRLLSVEVIPLPRPDSVVLVSGGQGELAVGSVRCVGCELASTRDSAGKKLSAPHTDVGLKHCV